MAGEGKWDMCMKGVFGWWSVDVICKAGSVDKVVRTMKLIGVSRNSDAAVDIIADINWRGYSMYSISTVQ